MYINATTYIHFRYTKKYETFLRKVCLRMAWFVEKAGGDTSCVLVTADLLNNAIHETSHTKCYVWCVISTCIAVVVENLLCSLSKLT